MMRGHNRPPFPPKVPRTDMRSWDVPTAIIPQPARSAMAGRTAGAEPFKECLEKHKEE